MNSLTRILLIGLVFSGVCRPAMPSSEGDLVPIQTLILEAENQGYEGMVAVGEVIRNRALKACRTPEWVCMRPKQFSCWNEPKKAQKRLSGVSGEIFQLASKAWVASSESLQTRGSTHYHTKAISPYWAKWKRPTAIIGDHIFYNNIN